MKSNCSVIIMVKSCPRKPSWCRRLSEIRITWHRNQRLLIQILRLWKFWPPMAAAIVNAISKAMSIIDLSAVMMENGKRFLSMWVSGHARRIRIRHDPPILPASRRTLFRHRLKMMRKKLKEAGVEKRPFPDPIQDSAVEAAAEAEGLHPAIRTSPMAWWPGISSARNVIHAPASDTMHL